VDDFFETVDRKGSDSAKYKRAAAKSDHPDPIALSVADSDYETAPVIKQALRERVGHGAFGYAGAGERFFQAIREWNARRYGLELEKSWILPAPKVLTSIAALVQALSEPGERIAIQTPVYHVFEPLIQSTGRKVAHNPLRIGDTRYEMDLKGLEAQLASGVRIVLLCSPHNPVGRVWSEQELSQLITLCRTYGATLLSDEIHADIIHPDRRFVSAGAFFGEYSKIVLINAPSKTFNIAGLQAAYVVAPDRHIRRRLKEAFQAMHIGAPNVLALRALEAAYEEGDGWVDAQNVHIQRQYERLQAAFADFLPASKIAPLEGTYLAWVDVSSSGMDGAAFTEGLYPYGVVLSPGVQFGGRSQAYVRIALSCSLSRLDEALRRMGDFCRAQMKE